MGGVEVKPIVCSDYNNAENIERDIELYINEGLRVEDDAFMTWSWFYLIPWFFSTEM